MSFSSQLTSRNQTFLRPHEIWNHDCPVYKIGSFMDKDSVVYNHSYRKSTVSTIISCCYLLDVSVHVQYHAISYFHRFLNFTEKTSSTMDPNFVQVDDILFLSSLIYLSCKVCEEVRRIRDVANVVKSLHGIEVEKFEFDEVIIIDDDADYYVFHNNL